jgi:23S rRNA (adenine2030-N6)-methyltransferase
MLSYQHVYHAGNHTDCHKHGIWSLLLARLQEKETPFYVRDTHSGRGLYDLRCDEAQKIQEYETGITKLWPQRPWPTELQAWQALIERLNATAITRYTGSPYLTASFLRAQDRAEFYELHPTEFEHLASSMDSFTTVTCHKSSGWDALAQHAAPPENRGMVLIDPSFELKEDYALMAPRLEKALQKWRNGIYVVWYPLLASNAHHIMLDSILTSSLRKILMSEMIFSDPSTTRGLYGSGMLILNPPWQIEETINDTMDWMVQFIGLHHECTWLVPE